MTRRIFPNEENRLVYGYTSADTELTSKAGATVTIYTDSACTTLANILTEAGGAVSGSVLTVDSDSRMPRFQGPDGTPFGVDTLYALVQGNVAPGEPIYARADDRLDRDTVIRCTSATRPGSPVDGQLILETDTDKLLIYKASVTQWITPRLDYARVKTTVTSNSAAVSAETTLATANIVGDGITKFKITGQWGAFTSTVVTDVFQYELYEDSTRIAAINRYAQSTTASAGDGGSITAELTPTSGAKAYTLRVVRLSGTGTITNIAAATQPTTIVVEEIQ